jgi:hypothetical protein
MWLRHHVAPALVPHPPTRPLTDWSTPTCIKLYIIMICSSHVGKGDSPRRGDRPERSAGWAQYRVGEVMQLLADQPARFSGQSLLVSGWPRRLGGSSLSPVPRDYVRIIGIIVIIEYIKINYYY